MADSVVITSPQTSLVQKGTTLTISWTNDYPYGAYEIQYKKSTDANWSTYGRVTSTAKTTTVDYSSWEDFQEYYYRVVLYSENSVSGTSYFTGVAASSAFVLIVIPTNVVDTYKAKYGNKLIEIPLYQTSDISSPKPELRMKSDNEVGTTALVEPNSPIASELKFNVRQGKKTAAPINQMVYTPTSNIPQSVELTVNIGSSYTYKYTYYAQYYVAAYSDSGVIPYYYQGYQSGYYYVNKEYPVMAYESGSDAYYAMISPGKYQLRYMNWYYSYVSGYYYVRDAWYSYTYSILDYVYYSEYYPAAYGYNQKTGTETQYYIDRTYYIQK